MLDPRVGHAGFDGWVQHNGSIHGHCEEEAAWMNNAWKHLGWKSRCEGCQLRLLGVVGVR